MGTFLAKKSIKKLLQLYKSVELKGISFSCLSTLRTRYNKMMYSLNSNEQNYFDEISNSFDGPALICDQLGKVLFSSKNCPFKESFLGSEELAREVLGTDLTTVKNGESIGFTIYKLMNPLQNYENQLFIVVFKTC